jgi:hypothetical protein
MTKGMSMKVLATAPVALLWALSATAQPEASAPRTREAVRAEAASAVKAGEIDHGEVTRVPPPVGAPPPRGAVKAETRAAVKAGQIEHGEGNPKQALPPSTRTRAEVKAEAASAIRVAPRPARATASAPAK